MLKKCPKCTLEKDVTEFGKCRSRPDGFSFYCKPCTNLRHATYREKHSQRLNAYKKDWALANRDAVLVTKRNSALKNREKVNAATCQRRKEDPLFDLAIRIRNRLNISFRRKGFIKTSQTAEMLGCTWEFLKGYLEAKFKPGMTWENRGLWHIDHIVPLNSAKSVEEMIKLSHYRNLQPLWAAENLSKSDRLYSDGKLSSSE